MVGKSSQGKSPFLTGLTRNHVQTINNGLGDATKKRSELKNTLQGEIKTVDEFAKTYKSETNAYLDSLLYLKSVATSCATEEDGIHQVYKNFILEQQKPEQVGDQAPP